MEENKVVKIISTKQIVRIVINALIPLFFVIIMNVFYTGINLKCWFPLEKAEGVIIEVAIVYTLFGFIWSIVKKEKIVITVLGIFFILLSSINQIKMSYTKEPVLLSDVLYLNSTGELVGIIQGSFISTLSTFIVPLLIEIVLFIVGIVIARRICGNIQISTGKARILIGGLTMVILILLFTPIKPINNFVKRTIFEENKRKDYECYTTMSQYYVSYGLIGGMYGQVLESRIQEPEDYNEEIVNMELANAKDNEVKTLGKPNIIVVFSESFWDVEQLEEVEFNKEVTPNFNKLKEKGLSFNMVSPVYGGISANVEYEFLTGSNVAYFNRGYVPYMQLYNNKTYYNRPSMIAELKNNGYKTKIVPCTSAGLFNCGRFYKYVGVDEVEYITDVDDKYIKGKYVSDEYVTDKIIEEFEKKNKDERLFYMTLTMQAHMPYAKDKYDKYDVDIEKSNLSQEENDTLASYAQGIYDADKQLGRLYEYIQTLDEPTIIVFYGDHLPYLYCGNENVIDSLGYFNTGDTTLDNYRLYNTQSLIVGNFDIEKDAENTKYLSPDLLGAYILNNMDIKIDNYYKWLYSSRKTIGAMNYFVVVDYNGNLVDTYNLDNELEKLYKLRRNIEYKLFVK